MSKKYCLKLLQVGPGGMFCHCCAPGPGKRKPMFRQARRRLDRALIKVENAELRAIAQEKCK